MTLPEQSANRPHCCARCNVLLSGPIKVSESGQRWHMDCWAKNLEGALLALQGYFTLGTPTEEDLPVMSDLIDDTLGGDRRS